MSIYGFKALLYIGSSIYSPQRVESRWVNGGLSAVCFNPNLLPTQEEQSKQESYTIKPFCTDVPTLHCTCGIHASAPYENRATPYMTSRESVMTIIESLDKTVRHESGWRAKIARVHAVVIPTEIIRYSFYYDTTQDIIKTADRMAMEWELPLVDLSSARAIVEASWLEYME